MIRKIGEPGDEQPAYQRIDPGDRKTPTPSQSAGLDVNAGVHLASPQSRHGLKVGNRFDTRITRPDPRSMRRA